MSHMILLCCIVLYTIVLPYAILLHLYLQAALKSIATPGIAKHAAKLKKASALRCFVKVSQGYTNMWLGQFC